VSSDIQSTKERLLNAAERLFAERGFAAVSIRDLSGEAGVNVAAVNYHFQSKDNLYAAVLLRRVQPTKKRIMEALARVPTDAAGRPRVDALIHAFVSTYLHDALVHPEGDTFLRLVMRELHDPHTTGDTFFKEFIVPLNQALASSLTKARPELDQSCIIWIIASIVGQVAHFIMRWRRGHLESDDQDLVNAPRALFPALAQPLDVYLRQVVEHVTRFTVGGIEAYSNDS